MKPFVVSKYCCQNPSLTHPSNHFPFAAGFDLLSIGSTKFRYGALLGIPTSYNYAATGDVDRSSIIIRGRPILDWNSRGGQLLSESLVLTEEEQIFGLVREMLYLKERPVYFRSFCSVGCVTFYYILTSFLNSKLRLFYRPLSLRIVLYCIAGFFIYGVHSLLQDYTQVGFVRRIKEILT